MPLSSVGLMAGTLFLAASLTPSLLPRPYVVQGVLSGLSFAAGYGLGVAGLALWRYLQLPLTGSRFARLVRAVSVAICALFALGSFWQAARWQNSIRQLMGMEESPGIQPVLLAVIGALVFLLALGLARLFLWVSHALSIRLGRYVPLRTSSARRLDRRRAAAPVRFGPDWK
jgi:uncharacterized membrane protein